MKCLKPLINFDLSIEIASESKNKSQIKTHRIGESDTHSLNNLSIQHMLKTVSILDKFVRNI